MLTYFEHRYGVFKLIFLEELLSNIEKYTRCFQLDDSMKYISFAHEKLKNDEILPLDVFIISNALKRNIICFGSSNFSFIFSLKCKNELFIHVSNSNLFIHYSKVQIILYHMITCLQSLKLKTKLLIMLNLMFPSITSIITF